MRTSPLLSPVVVTVLALSAVLGLVVGSFLNVVIHRVPRGESVARPRSRCPDCEVEIAPRDNIPVLSWLLLRGKCRHCSAPISGRYAIVEVATAGLFAMSALRFGPTVEAGAFAVLFASLVVVTAIDLELRLIPKRVVWPSFLGGAALLAAATVVIGRPRLMVDSLAGSVGAFAVLFVIHLVSPRGMGFGDVRLAALLGLYLGWLGPAHVGLGIFLGFLFGGVAGVAALTLGRSRKSALPFAPFLALGTVTAVMIGRPILDWYLPSG